MQSAGMSVFVAAAIFIGLVTYLVIDLARKQGAKEAPDERAKLIGGICAKAEDLTRELVVANEKAQTRLQELVAPHMATLNRKQWQLITQDDYGNYQFDRWFAECSYFVEHVVQKDAEILDLMLEVARTAFALKAVSAEAEHFSLEEQERHSETFDRLTAFNEDHSCLTVGDEEVDLVTLDSVAGLVSHAVLTSAAAAPDDDPDFSSVRNGTDYEHFCAQVLEQLGWDVQHRGGTADQGVDLVGSLCGFVVVFQCKLYSSPVGNKAVQEAIAGKAFEGAHAAAVVTNSSYTAHAKQLASSVGAAVELLHHEQLKTYTEELLAAFEASALTVNNREDYEEAVEALQRQAAF